MAFWIEQVCRKKNGLFFNAVALELHALESTFLQCFVHFQIITFIEVLIIGLLLSDDGPSIERWFELGEITYRQAISLSLGMDNSGRVLDLPNTLNQEPTGCLIREILLKLGCRLWVGRND